MIHLVIEMNNCGISSAKINSPSLKDVPDNRGSFRSFSNIYDPVFFCKNSERLLVVDHIHKKLCYICLTQS